MPGIEEEKGLFTSVGPWWAGPFFCWSSKESWDGLEEPGARDRPSPASSASKAPTAKTARPTTPPSRPLIQLTVFRATSYSLPRSHDITITAPPYARRSNTGPRHSLRANARALPRHVIGGLRGDLVVSCTLVWSCHRWVACSSSSHGGGLSRSSGGEAGAVRRAVSQGEEPRNLREGMIPGEKVTERG